MYLLREEGSQVAVYSTCLLLTYTQHFLLSHPLHLHCPWAGYSSQCPTQRLQSWFGICQQYTAIHVVNDLYYTVKPHLSGYSFIQKTVWEPIHIPNYIVIHLSVNSVIRTVSLGTKVSGYVRLHCSYKVGLVSHI